MQNPYLQIPLKGALQIFLLSLSITAFGQQPPDQTSVTIVQLSEQEYYQLREKQLHSLDQELLRKGNWSDDDLKQFARHFPYKHYLNQLDELKKDVEKIGIQRVQIVASNGDITSKFTIIHSFKGEIYSGGGIGLMIYLNLYKEQNPILTDTYWKKVKKKLKSWLKSKNS